MRIERGTVCVRFVKKNAIFTLTIGADVKLVTIWLSA
jgi:hypothetical protein